MCNYFNKLDDTHAIAIIILLTLTIVFLMQNKEGFSLENSSGSANVSADASANRVVKQNLPSNSNNLINNNKDNFKNFKFGDVLNGPPVYADANQPYGFNLPPSMVSSKELLNNYGMANDSALNQEGLVTGYSKFMPIDSVVKSYDPTYGGGLLNNQIDDNLKSVVDYGTNLPRNDLLSSKGDILPSNIDLHSENATDIKGSRRIPSILSNNLESNSNNNGNGNGNNGNNGNGKELNLKMIYTNWCGHSKRALPDFNKLMDDHNGKNMNGYKINISKHDADVEKDVAKKYGVKGFPSYVLETSDGVKDVNERSYDGLVNTLKENAV